MKKVLGERGRKARLRIVGRLVGLKEGMVRKFRGEREGGKMGRRGGKGRGGKGEEGGGGFEKGG